MATVLEELLIALRVEDGNLKAELAKIIDQARKAGGEGEKALKPFETGLSRVAAEARAGLRPLSDYRDELKKQEAELKRVADAQDKNTGEYRQTVEQLTGVKRELASVNTELATHQTWFDRIGNRLTTFGGILSAGVTAPLAILGGTGVKSAMQLEVFQKSLETLVGDADEAKAVFEELYEFDTKTTFSWPSLTKATTLLSAFNVEAHDLIPTLGRLGDISAAVQMDVAELADTYGRMKVSGRVTMLELNQLMGRGIPIVQELAKNMGVNEAAIKDMASTGKLSFSDIEKAFMTLTSEGGRFHNMMQSQTDTTQGRVMALRKEFEQVTDQIGEALLPTLDGLVDRARKAVQWFVDLDEDTQKLVINTGLFAAALGPLLLGLGQVVRVAGELRTAFVALRAAGLLAMGPAGWIVLGVGVVAGLALAFSGKPDSLDKSLEKAREALAGGDAKSLKSALDEVIDKVDGDVRTVFKDLRDDLEKTGDVGAAQALRIARAFKYAQEIVQAQQRLAEAQARLAEAQTLAQTFTATGKAVTPSGEVVFDTEREERALAEKLLNMGESEVVKALRFNNTTGIASLAGGASVDDLALVPSMVHDLIEAHNARLEALTVAVTDVTTAVSAEQADVDQAARELDELWAKVNEPLDPMKDKPDPGGDNNGDGVKAPAEVLAELEATRKRARGIALAHGETLEALAAETQTMIGATSKAIEGLIAASVDPQDEQVQKLVADLGTLGEEADRLKKALTPIRLTANPTAVVNPDVAAGQQAIADYQSALAEIDVRRSLGLLDEEAALQAHLNATQAVIDKMVSLYGGLTAEQRAFVTDATSDGARITHELERLQTLAELQDQRRANQRAREVQLQTEYDDDNAVAEGVMTPDEQKAWVAAYRGAQAAAAKEKRLAANARRQEALAVTAEAHTLGVQITDALRAGSLEGLGDLETAVVAKLDEYADSTLGTVFAGLLTRVRAARAEVQEAQVEAARQSAITATTQEQFYLHQNWRWSAAGALDAYTHQAMLKGDRDNIRPLNGGVFAALDEEQTAFVNKVRGELGAAMDFAAQKAALLGDAYDLPREQLRLMQTAIEKLVEEGKVDFSNPTVQLLAEDFRNLGHALAEADENEKNAAERLQAFEDAMAFARDALGEMPGPLEQNIDLLKSYRAGLKMDEEGAAELAGELDRLIAGLERLKGIEDSGLRKFAGDLRDLSSVVPGLGSVFARASADVAEGLHKIAETDDKLEGTAQVISGVATAIEGIAAAAEDGGLDGNQVLELIGGIASVAGEAIGALTGIPGLGKVVASAFQLVTAVVGDLGNGLQEIQDQVDETVKSTPLLARETLDAFAHEYTRRVSRGGIAGSFGATKAELDEEAFDAAVNLAGTFANTMATALAAADYAKSADLGFKNLIRDQLIEAFILSPEVQAQIKAMVDFWKEAWEDGNLTDDERKRWEALKQGLIASGEATREQLKELGLLEDEETKKARTGGARITDLTGPARDHFSDLLAPLRHLGAQLTELQGIRGILDARLPAWNGPMQTPRGGGNITIDKVVIEGSSVKDARTLFDELSRVAERIKRGR